jgi:protease IV
VAEQKGLITNIGYEDEARNAVRAKAGAGARLIDFARYYQSTRNRNGRRGAPVIALVHAAGDIVEGKNNGPVNDAAGIAGDTYADAIRAAAADRDVKAILLRVDSPGGSAIASDQILHALKAAHARGKPIIVSMGSVAASGGYYIAMAGDRIVAEPGTLTGSIGVLWGKFALGKSAQLIGVNARELGVGKNALFGSPVTPWDAEQLKSVNQQADAVYADFTQKVAEGRKMPLEHVQEIARGRVWTGADAKERGLVDELGGFWTAVDDARRVANIPQNTEVAFKTFPRPRGLFGTVSRLAEGSSAALKMLDGLDTLMQSPPIRTLVAAIRGADMGVQLSAPELP